MSTAAQTHGPVSARPPALVITVLGFCGIVVALMQTLIVPLVPILPRILHASPANASWAITATLLSGAVVTPIAGRLGDMFGKRRILLISLAALIVGSVICALGTTLIPVVVGRVLQGAATGVIPLGISIMRDELPAERVGSAMAIMSATLGVGGAIGMPVAAVIAEKADWHTLFWVSGGLGVLSLLVVITLIPESSVTSRGSFDYLGAVGLSAALVALLLAITKGNDWGWSSDLTLGLLAASVVLLVLWGAYELRRTQPLVDLRVSARRQVLFTNLASVAVGFAMYGMSLIPSQILMAPKATGYGMGLSMVQAGLMLTPSGLAMFALSPMSARISARSGPRTSLLTGALVIMVGYILTLVLRDNPAELMVAMIVVGGGIGIAYAAMPALIMSSVPLHETAAANGLNSLMRAVGTSLSAAAISVVLAARTMSLGPAKVPAGSGFTIAIWITIVACALTIGLTLLIPCRASEAAPVLVEAESEPVAG
ncbi:MFS transporter [Leekyejoonella antrihumi]|uniref:MFS transporter n=1 Tax=Leekyejoonella antrihumi TaxID=1660198 RepID=A0A563E8X1_9MICO|nr:MFS transporter [Leekyejoonella antrihumi]TWP38966.1 MFS transporter [Leekyejoonella antrihumi]